MNTMHLEIDGMTCGHCVGSVKKALESLDGVSVDAVAIGSADVRYEPRQTSAESVLEAVADAGYPAHVRAARA